MGNKFFLHQIKCTNGTYEKGIVVKDSYDEIGSIIVEDDVRIDEMFSSQDIPNKWYDVDSYSFFMKSGSRTKYFSIQGPVLSSYPSFHWIIEQAEWINKI